MISQTGYTTDEVAALLGCCRNNTTRKIEQLAERLAFVVGAYGAVRCRRRRQANNVAEQLVSLIETGGKLAVGDRARFKRFVRQVVEKEIRHDDGKGATDEGRRDSGHRPRGAGY